MEDVPISGAIVVLKLEYTSRRRIFISMSARLYIFNSNVSQSESAHKEIHGAQKDKSKSQLLYKDLEIFNVLLPCTTPSTCRKSKEQAIPLIYARGLQPSIRVESIRIGKDVRV
jgi:hypothetical protein